MKTIIWKELRENWKWALLAFLCLILAEFYTLSEQRDSTPLNDLTLCASTFLLVTSFGCSVAGAALGAVQIFPELQKDRWAALLHRPVSRSVIFRGKIIAGLLLYFIATVLPLLASIAYVAAPGQFPGPLVPGMVLPAASDLFLGMTFYFGAMLIALEQGRWFGRRGALGLCLVAVFVSHMITSWMFVIPLVFSAILMTAAFGAMAGNGQAKVRSTAARVSFILAVFVGIEAVVLIADWGLSFLPAPTGPGYSDGIYRDFRLASDGRVLVATQRGDDSAMSLTDTNGKPVTDERYIGNDSRGLSYFQPICWSFGKESAIDAAYEAQYSRSLRNRVALAYGYGQQSREAWYELVRQNYFVGYDKLSRRCVGICDREGFHPADAAPKPFPDRLKTTWDLLSGPSVFWSGVQLYELDFPERSMTALFNARGDVIHAAKRLGPNGSAASCFAVVLEKHILVLGSSGTPLFAIPYTHDPQIWPRLSLETIPTADRLFLEYERDYDVTDPKPEDATRPAFVDEIDLKGNVLHSYGIVSDISVPMLPGLPVQAAAYTLPFLAAAIRTISLRAFPPKDNIRVYSSYQPPSLNVPLSNLAILFGISSALGICAFLWASSVGFSKNRALGWAAFVFCLGLPGFITFRLAADWPTRVRCPNCSAKRPTEDEECPACHQGWPSAEKSGNEIFDLVRN